MFDDVGMEITILGYDSTQKWDIALQILHRVLYSPFETSLTCLARPVWWAGEEACVHQDLFGGANWVGSLLCLKFPIDNQYLLIQL